MMLAINISSCSFPIHYYKLLHASFKCGLVTYMLVFTSDRFPVGMIKTRCAGKQAFHQA